MKKLSHLFDFKSFIFNLDKSNLSIEELQLSVDKLKLDMTKLNETFQSKYGSSLIYHEKDLKSFDESKVEVSRLNFKIIFEQNKSLNKPWIDLMR